MELIETFCSRFAAKDSEAFAALFTDEAVYRDSLYGTITGKEAIRAFHIRCHREARAFRFKPLKILFNREGLAAFEWAFSFHSLMPQCLGKEITLEGASFLNLQGERISSYREYADSIALLLQGDVPDRDIVAFFRKKYALP